ncbi:MAG: CvpA family protein [Erysipelothrix sp.]|nr:CvpA family protein [Erysipelothrix sp.]
MILFNNSALIMNLIVLALFIFFIGVGYRKGLISQVFNLFTLLIAFFIANFLYDGFGLVFKITPTFLVPFHDTVLEGFFYYKINSFVWFIIIFVISFIFLKFLKVIFVGFSKVPGISAVNKLLGAGLGFINFLIASFIIIYIASMPIFTNGISLIENSGFKYVSSTIDLIVPMVGERLETFGSIENLITMPNKASLEDIENLKEYLEANEITDDIIKRFLWEIEQ